jgi:hypothetical protein
VWCVDFHREGGIYRGEWDLHRLGEVSLALGGGRRPGVDAWNPRRGPNHRKPWSGAKELGRLAGPWAHLAWGLAHLVHMLNTLAW